MEPLRRLDLGTVAGGAAVQVAVTLPPTLVIRALTQDDVGSESNLSIVAVVLALLVAPAAGALFVAARHRPSPVAHAAAGALVAWITLAVVTIVRVAADSSDVFAVIPVLPLLALVEVGVAVVTAHLAARSSSRRHPHT